MKEDEEEDLINKEQLRKLQKKKAAGVDKKKLKMNILHPGKSEDKEKYKKDTWTDFLEE